MVILIEFLLTWLVTAIGLWLVTRIVPGVRALTPRPLGGGLGAWHRECLYSTGAVVADIASHAPHAWRLRAGGECPHNSVYQRGWSPTLRSKDSARHCLPRWSWRYWGWRDLFSSTGWWAIYNGPSWSHRAMAYRSKSGKALQPVEKRAANRAADGPASFKHGLCV